MASAGNCPNAGKSSWPELFRTRGNEAVRVIERENSNVDASTVLEGSFITTEIRCDRVRVWVNTNGIVTRVPVIG